LKIAIKSWGRPLAAAAMCLLLGGCALAPEEGDGRKEAQPLVFPPPPDPARFVFENALYSSVQVIPEDRDTALRRALTGESSRGEGMAKPYAVAVHQGRIFVSDTADRVVKVFDVAQGRFFKIGADDPGALTKPMGLDVSDDGTLFVADITAKAILVYNRDGKFLRKLGNPKDFDRLSSVTVDGKGERLYLVDIGGVSSDRHVVHVISAKDGSMIMDIGRRGVGEGEFNLPRDTALGKDGRLYVVDGGNFRVQVFDRDGRYLKSFGKIGKQLGDFARPKEVATDRTGNVYVADAAFGNFQIFSPEGELLMFVGDRGEQDAPARYMLPSGIFVDEDGRVYMVDQWFRKVEIFRPVTLQADQGFLVYRSRRP
jgi:DNA-binding beta-propeller fold protein YncE